MATQAQAAVGEETEDDDQTLTVLADPGYYKGEEIVDCYEAGIRALVPKVDTSGKKAQGQYTRTDFRYDANKDEYRCPAGEVMPYKFTTEEKGKTLRVYMTFKCPDCPLKAKCTTGQDRRIKRWVEEHWLEHMEAEIKKDPNAMRLRKQIVEHPYGTIKHWMGSTHFLMKRLPNVQAKMSLSRTCLQSEARHQHLRGISNHREAAVGLRRPLSRSSPHQIAAKPPINLPETVFTISAPTRSSESTTSDSENFSINP